jgi:hypothetical protein
MNTQHATPDAIRQRQLARIEAMLAATRYAWLIEHATVEQHDTGAVWTITVPCGDAEYVEDAIDAAMRKDRATRKKA